MNISRQKYFLTSALLFSISCVLLISVVMGSQFVVKQKKSSDQNMSKLLTTEQFMIEKNELIYLVKRQDPHIALQNLRDRMKGDTATLRSCHPLAHEIGRAAFQKYGSFSSAMQYQDEICNSGYLHGVIESSFLTKPNMLSNMTQICGQTSKNYDLWQCYHGIGHGIMYYTDNNLPLSVLLCKKFTTEFTRSNCINGVFMENFATDQKIHRSLYLKVADPFYPCALQEEKNKQICYYYAPTYYLSMNPNNYKGAVALCTQLSDGYQKSCITGVGGQAMKENIKNPKFVEALCMTTGVHIRPACIGTIVAMYINHVGSPDAALSLCKSLDMSNQQACYKVIRDEVAKRTNEKS